MEGFNMSNKQKIQDVMKKSPVVQTLQSACDSAGAKLGIAVLWKMKGFDVPSLDITYKGQHIAWYDSSKKKIVCNTIGPMGAVSLDDILSVAYDYQRLYPVYSALANIDPKNLPEIEG
jgi:hypothetical protein